MSSVEEVKEVSVEETVEEAGASGAFEEEVPGTPVEEAVADAEESEKEEARWYVVHTFSGYENKVKVDLEKTVENRKLTDKILEVVVPVQEVTEKKEGKKKTTKRKIFPAYVLVRMIKNDDTWFIVRNTRGVTGFVGADPTDPVPLTDEEMAALSLFVDSEETIIPYEKDEVVNIVNGSLKGKQGRITSVNTQKETVSLVISMMGRDTPVTLSFSDIRKI